MLKFRSIFFASLNISNKKTDHFFGLIKKITSYLINNKKKLSKALKTLGFLNLMLGFFLIIRNYFLCRIFKFNSWHINSNYYLRPYKKVAVDMANSLKFNNVIDVGCGLCDILSRIKCNRKIGVDIDKNIIKACKMICKKITFINASIFEDCDKLNLNNDYFPKDNLLICLNWLHGYSWVKIQDVLKNMFRNNKMNYLIIDIINYDPNNQYKFHHTEDDLLKIGNILIKQKIKKSNRTLYLLNLKF